MLNLPRPIQMYILSEFTKDLGSLISKMVLEQISNSVEPDWHILPYPSSLIYTAQDIVRDIIYNLPTDFIPRYRKYLSHR